jgi:DNA-binding NarL/FixJ family response regulator
MVTLPGEAPLGGNGPMRLGNAAHSADATGVAALTLSGEPPSGRWLQRFDLYGEQAVVHSHESRWSVGGYGSHRCTRPDRHQHTSLFTCRPSSLAGWQTGAVIRVVLADDQALVRAGFRALLERTDDIEVVGEASDGAEVVELVRRTRPDVALLDVQMPKLDGVEAARIILADDQLAGTRIVVLTTFDVDEYVFGALRAGVSGFLLKDVDPEELRQAVRVVAAGQALLSPSVTRRVIARFAGGPGRSLGSVTTSDARLAPLTDREREVVALVARGLSNEEIARELVVSAATSKTHVNRAMTKLGVRDRAQLVVLAYETGLVGG